MPYLGIYQKHLLDRGGGLAHGVLVQHAEGRHGAETLDEAAAQHRHGQQSLLAALSMPMPLPTLPLRLVEARCL